MKGRERREANIEMRDRTEKGMTERGHVKSTCKEIGNESDKNDKNPKYHLRIMEALYIRRFNSGPNSGMNEDMGSYVTTNQWQPVFNRMG